MSKVEKLSILVLCDCIQELDYIFNLIIEKERQNIKSVNWSQGEIETDSKLYHFYSGSEREILDKVKGIRIDRVYGGEVPDFLKPYIGRHGND